MDRRQFVKSSVAATVGVATQGRSETKLPTRPPNVLYVFSDQHRALSLPGEAFNQAIAPNIDAFRRQSFSMDRCISNYPLCTPYRAILMTGRWPFQTGMTHNGATINPNEISLGDSFAKAGYHTGYIGKWHLDGPELEVGFIPKGPKRLGFEDWHVWDRTNDHYHSWTYNPETGEKIFPEGWQPTRMTDEAITFLKAQTQEKPWFLILSWNPPHPPFNPPDEDMALYPPDGLKFRPNVKLRTGERLAGPAHPLTSEDLLRKALQGYYGAITGVDKEFARLLKTLDETGQADNTIVIYTSDHGEMMGSQGRMAKQAPFEESCRVPFAVRFPGRTPKSGKSNHLFAAIDIYPTVCGLAGLPIPETCRGRDFSPLMRGKSMSPSGAVFLMNEIPNDLVGDVDKNTVAEPSQSASRRAALQRSGPGVNVSHGPTERAIEMAAGNLYVGQPGYRGLRTDTHTYAVAADGRWLLYDNVSDPHQMKNLVRDPAQKPLMAKLDALIENWLKVAGDPFPYAGALTKFSSFAD